MHSMVKQIQKEIHYTQLTKLKFGFNKLDDNINRPPSRDSKSWSSERPSSERTRLDLDGWVSFLLNKVISSNMGYCGTFFF